MNAQGIIVIVVLIIIAIYIFWPYLKNSVLGKALTAFNSMFNSLANGLGGIGKIFKI